MIERKARKRLNRPLSVRRHGFPLLLAAALLLAGAPVYGGDASAPAPGEKEKCPVCGMFVAKYPDFLAAVRLRDGEHLYFDGPKDLFRFLHAVERYAPARRPDDVEAVFVKDYYSLEQVDGRKAFYAAGSDVYGPMGRELVPFAKEKDARRFLKDHKGQSLYRFGEVTPRVLEGLQ